MTERALNDGWHKFKESFQQTAQMLPGGLKVRPKNRAELRDLIRHDPIFKDVRRIVFGAWRNR